MGSQVAFGGQPTRFVGYDTLAARAQILAIYKEGSQVAHIDAGEAAVVVLDSTPFYAESGGQVGDRGELACGNGVFNVEDTQKIQAEVFGHKGMLATGRLSVGDTVDAKVDMEARYRAAYNHSATHLMHAALRQVLGKHVAQRGSLVDATRTRFDFSHPEPVTPEQIKAIETLVNAEIRANHPVVARLMKYDEAIKVGAMALFGEKYGDEVRVISMGDFSTELCGGTHVHRSGDIGLFKIVSESGVAAGVRRIDAVTGPGAIEYLQEQESQLATIAGLLKSPLPEVPNKLAQIQEQVRSLEKELARLKSRLAANQGSDLVEQATEVAGIRVIASVIENADAKALRELADQIRNKLQSCALVLGSVSEGKVTLIAAVTPDLTAKIKAGDLVNQVASQVGGKGGGRPDMAQAGGTLPDHLPKAMSQVADWIQMQLTH